METTLRCRCACVFPDTPSGFTFLTPQPRVCNWWPRANDQCALSEEGEYCAAAHVWLPFTDIRAMRYFTWHFFRAYALCCRTSVHSLCFFVHCFCSSPGQVCHCLLSDHLNLPLSLRTWAPSAAFYLLKSGGWSSCAGGYLTFQRRPKAAPAGREVFPGSGFFA